MPSFSNIVLGLLVWCVF